MFSLLRVYQSSKRHGQDRMDPGGDDVISCHFSVERSVRITATVEIIADDKVVEIKKEIVLDLLNETLISLLDLRRERELNESNHAFR